MKYQIWFGGLFGSLCLMYAAASPALTLPSPHAGSDGSFAPTSNIVVNLALATTGKWDETAGSGNGVYDPEQWAVIFRFASISIPSNVTVTFQNHPSRAPVIWLATDAASINGTVNLDGARGSDNGGVAFLADNGPGGFRGGRGQRGDAAWSGGFGPGGAPSACINGSYANGRSYGNEGIFPLIGGSGGGGCTNGNGGSGGGGAILIATPAVLTINGSIRAYGGDSHNGGGSGGGIRLIADRVQGTGTLAATAWRGGSAGRIRVEANSNALTDVGNPPFSFDTPGQTPRILRAAGDGVPTIRAVTLDGRPIPVDPRASHEFPLQDATLDRVGLAELEIEAENVPAGSTVIARVVRANGSPVEVSAAFNGVGPGNVTLWVADIDVVEGFSNIQVRAILPQ